MLNGFKRVDWAWRKINQSKEKWLVSLASRIPSWVTPDGLSWLRIGAASVILPMLFQYDRFRVWIIISFLAAAVSDILDGPIARFRDQETEGGALFDRLADKLLVCPMVVHLFWGYNSFLAGTVVLSEIFSISLAISAMAKQVPSKSNWLAKWKMGAQGAGILILLFLPNRTHWAFAAFVSELVLGVGSFWESLRNYINSRPKTV